ncbi:MAG: DNA replication and repair protein RecF [Bdellovibrionaceae bacterium]|nr:DNA replication and repair protein RecF [Pseudobdellovibrionaceae bacterium]
MFVENIFIKNFRNIQDAQTHFSKNLNVFLGKNGQGKTNLLESIYLLVHGNSFRYSNNESFINYSTQQSFIQSNFHQSGLKYNLKMSIQKSSKEFFLNEKKTSSSQIQKKFSIVLFSPESLSFIKESSEFRRVLVDEFLTSVDIKNVDIINDFRKTLKNRNRLLKDLREEKISRSQFEPLFDSLTEIYLQKSADLVWQRIDALGKIKDDLNDNMRYISQQNVEIFVDYVASDESFLSFSRLKVLEKMQKRSQELRSAEIASGSSLVGPHKHEILFLYNQKDSRFFCSQGQQRAIILSFKMAQIVYHRRVHGTFPILLLDDVLSELDYEKRFRLVEFLENLKTQIFITSTEIDSIENLNKETVQVKYLENGIIKE